MGIFFCINLALNGQTVCEMRNLRNELKTILSCIDFSQFELLTIANL